MASRLLLNFPRAGRVGFIGVRPGRGEPVVATQEVQAIERLGLQGDRTAAGRGGGRRQVTLIQAEHLPVIAALAGVEAVDPAITRRNIVVSGINLTALRNVYFRIGEAVFLGTGPCAPCSKMEAAFGEGGLNAMRGHGGLCAQVVRGGRIAVGDAVGVFDEDRPPEAPRLPFAPDLDEEG